MTLATPPPHGTMSNKQRQDPSPSLLGVGNLSSKGPEDTWVQIQHKTFSNWVNEQLTSTGRTVDNLATDFCDGVKLVALIEALQFRKIGRVYTKPRSKIQMLQNVQLAFEAIAEDQIRLVNIGEWVVYQIHMHTHRHINTPALLD